MGTSSQFLAFFKMAPTADIMHLSMLSPRMGEGVAGILTFSEKMRQIPHPRDNIIGQKYQKPPRWDE